MAAELPELSEFRLEIHANGLAHVVFDAPGRTMNVFSEAAIVEIGHIARWLEEADVKGALIRSGKTNGFCAGADLPEIRAAYDTIATTPKPRRFRTAYNRFFRLSLALSALETCGKPVASAVAGLALGCVLADEAAALARRLADGPTLAFGGAKNLMLSSPTENLEGQLENEARARARVTRTEDAFNAMRAMLAKQKPQFQGR